VHDPLPQKLLVHDADGEYFMDAADWPKLMTADENTTCTQESSLEGQLSDEGDD